VVLVKYRPRGVRLSVWDRPNSGSNFGFIKNNPFAILSNGVGPLLELKFWSIKKFNKIQIFQILVKNQHFVLKSKCCLKIYILFKKIHILF